MLRSTLILIFLVYGISATAQLITSALNPEQTNLLQAYEARSEHLKPTGYAPYLISTVKQDSIFDANTRNWERKNYSNWILRKLKNEHLFEVDKQDFHLEGDAAFNLETGDYVDAIGRRAYTNTRGYSFKGTVGKRIFFQTTFFETQSIFTNYMDSVVSTKGDFNETGGNLYNDRGAVPGYGSWKPFTRYKSSYDYDYTLATGSFGVAINENSFVQFGHDKQFVGYGYRSHLLSDASSPYPFLRAQISFWEGRVTYNSTWAVLQSLDPIVDVSYGNKEVMNRRLGARFNYLSVQPAPWFSFGLFDGTTWTWRRNSSPGSIEYYSPHGFLYTGNGIRNHIVGFNGQATLFKMVRTYGQFALNTKGRGMAAQAGVKVFGPVDNMVLQLEYNKVGQNYYYYAQGANGTVLIDEPIQTGTQAIDYYQNNDMVLGHPMGVALDEILIKGSYRLRDFFGNGSLNIVNQNSVSNPKDILFLMVEGGYVVNPKSNAQIAAGILYRDEKSLNNSGMKTVYPFIAIRTNLFNRYQDF